MLWFALILPLLGSALGCSEVLYTPCPPSTLKIVIRSHRNQTSSWQTSTINQGGAGEENQDTWKMIVEHRSVVDTDGHSVLESVINLRAQGNALHQDIIHIGDDKLETISEPLRAELLRKGYSLYPGVGYYKFHHNVTTWPSAHERCAQEGGHLVVINSAAEREVVRSMFTANPESEGSSNVDQIHAGLQRVAEGKYATIFGVPIEETGFSEWHPGQPSSGSKEPCVSIMKLDTAYNDISCRIQILAFICEIEL